MKVVCINNEISIIHKRHSNKPHLNIDKFNLTIGKIYNATCFNSFMSGERILNFRIIDDSGILMYLDERHIISLEKWREQQLNKLF
jgi:hypothetical protein